MKKYIFFTSILKKMGGIQQYICSKAKYLCELGYEVYAFTPKFDSPNYVIKDILEYLKNFEYYELYYRPYNLSNRIINHIISLFRKNISFSIDDEIIIESHMCGLAEWGDLLANNISCKNFCFILNEQLVGPNKTYLENIEFYKNKFKNHSIAFIDKKVIKDFCELANIRCNDSSDYILSAAAMDIVQDVDNVQLNNVRKMDINIAYISRFDKLYTSKVIDDLVLFCETYREKKISIIFVGDAIEHRDVIDKLFLYLTNVTINFTGNLIPIPKKLFELVDVVIAGAGCALHSANQGTKVLIADSQTYLCNGVLGVDTDNAFHNDNVQESYLHFLKKIFKDGLYCNLVIDFRYKQDTTIYDEHFIYLNKYPCVNSFDLNNYFKRKDIKKIIKLYFQKNFLFRIIKKMFVWRNK